MSRHTFRAALCALIFWAATQGASAVTVEVLPGDSNVFPGDVLALEVWADLGNVQSLGGNISLTWDSSALDFEAIDAEPIFDPQFFAAPVVEDGQARNWSVGSFATITGRFQFGTLYFTVRPGFSGTTLLDVGPGTGLPGFLDDFGGTLLNVDYMPATIVSTPLPAAGWMMLAALAALRVTGSGRRSR